MSAFMVRHLLHLLCILKFVCTVLWNCTYYIFFSTLLLVLRFPWPNCSRGRLNQWSHVSPVFWRCLDKVPIRIVSNLIFHGFPQSFYANTEIASCNNAHLFHFTLRNHCLILFDVAYSIQEKNFVQSSSKRKF